MEEFVVIPKEEAKRLHTVGVPLTVLKTEDGTKAITAVTLLGIPFKRVEDKEEAKELLKDEFKKLGIKEVSRKEAVQADPFIAMMEKEGIKVDATIATDTEVVKYSTPEESEKEVGSRESLSVARGSSHEAELEQGHSSRVSPQTADTTSSENFSGEKTRKIFWLDGDYKAMGGYYWRGWDLKEFIEKVEKQVGEVVGIAIEPDSDNKEKYSANIEFIVKQRND
jgi:hypothetical protein